ncbi:hypothetical protein WAI453_013309 [Rhynchosporium graminicola]
MVILLPRNKEWHSLRNESVLLEGESISVALFLKQLVFLFLSPSYNFAWNLGMIDKGEDEDGIGMGWDEMRCVCVSIGGLAKREITPLALSSELYIIKRVRRASRSDVGLWPQMDDV